MSDENTYAVDAMEWLLGLAAIVAIYYFVTRAKKQEQHEVADRGLRYFEIGLDPGEITGWVHGVDFVEMTWTERYDTYHAADRETYVYTLRRKDGITWQRILTPDSFRSRVAHLMRQKEGKQFWTNDDDKELNDLTANGARWRKLGAGYASQVEARYQQFLVRYRSE